MSDQPTQHLPVFHEEDAFAGWPANNGIWRYGNEILVGFILAKHKDTDGHSYDNETARRMFARSVDGGESWVIEDAFEAGMSGQAHNHRIGAKAKEPVDCPDSLDFTHPGFALTFDRANNADGPTSFHYSYDRGHSWTGPFVFPNFDTAGVAARTDYIVDGPHSMMVFLTAAKSDHREGRVLCAETVDGARSWTKLSWIGPEQDGYAIMPASVRLTKSEILVVIRRKTSDRAWLDAYRSADNGRSWQPLDEPAGDLGGGNPPAMIRLTDGRVCLAYGVRNRPRYEGDVPHSQMCVRFSPDGGKSWGEQIVVRGGDGANWDMGYPRMVQRPDGKVVLIYYYNHALLDGPPFRYIAATIFDPRSLQAS